MRIAELSLRNFRVFEEVDLELPARVIGIFGSNGSGKTTLLDSIRFALYGETRTHKKHIRTHGVLTDAAVRLVFEHGGQQYELRRTIKGKNHAVEAELFVAGGALASGATEVTRAVEGLLRMDQQVFRASVFAEQKQLDAFSDVEPRKRKDMVLRLLGIRPVDDARSAARKAARDAKGDAERLQSTLPDLGKHEKERERVATEAEGAVVGAEQAAEALAEADRRAGAAIKAFDASEEVRREVEVIAVERRGCEEQAEAHARTQAQLTERIETLERDLDDLPGLQEELGVLDGVSKRLFSAQRAVEVTAEVATMEERLEALAPEEAAEALAGLEAAQKERDSARDAAARAETGSEVAAQEMARAEEALQRASGADPTEPCPTCGRPLGDDFEEYVQHCRSAVATAKAAVEDRAARRRQVEERLAAAEAAFVQATRAGTAAQSAMESRKHLEERLAESRAALEGFLEAFDGAMPDLDALAAGAEREAQVRKRLAELVVEQKRVDEARRDLEVATAELKTCRTKIEELDRRAAKLAFDPEDHARLRKERDEAARLVEQSRTAEREARDLLAAVQRELARLEGVIAQARETADQVDRLRDDARYLSRITALLDGFRDHLVGRIGPALQREAEALFRELTAAEYEDLRINEETLAIEIADGADYFPIERFSGSEVDLANLALRVAISKHLSYMSGADIGMLVLDEVLGSLDVERKDLFVRAMGRLSGHFHQLFVITHAEQVKDQFQAVIEVQKVDRRRSRAVLA